MKTSLSFVSLSTLFIAINAQSSLTIFAPVPTDTNGSPLAAVPPSLSFWVDPVGTASDGSETTYLYHEIDSGDAFLFGDFASTVATTSFTMIASASGYKMPDLDSMSFDCTLESSNTGGCVYVAPADEGGTSLVTVSETGLPITFIDIPISAATQTAGSSPSGSGSGTASPTGGNTAPSSTSNPKNGAASILSSPGSTFFGLMVAIGFTLVF
ncbi:hypothetical protein BDP27DRAFT_1371508 [Rhodocollybia butyracea]|uniref:Uncharacterized protein n=1 Tax=Rhodocollybia butyracea TaxID=206335 RepID=A0A9P5PA71_9AGAR|nr:hypothetical protein BDP27DRAFT_1371508 [Rhodocollybia butyracea]